MHSREQYLERVREEYRKADKKGKTRLLNEARKRTRLNRKVLIGKLAHPAVERRKKKRGPRQATAATMPRVSASLATSRATVTPRSSPRLLFSFLVVCQSLDGLRCREDSHTSLMRRTQCAAWRFCSNCRTAKSGAPA